jgi:HPt (histidine-containing phosphotransfer) domain-containing protein
MGEEVMLPDHATQKEHHEVVETVQAPSLVPDRAIDLAHLARVAHEDQATMWEMLRVFDLQADVLVARLTSEEPKVAAARAHTLAVSAKSVGAWKVAESAAGFERAALSTGPVVLSPAMNRLTKSVTEAQVEINSLLAGQTSTKKH